MNWQPSNLRHTVPTSRAIHQGYKQTSRSHKLRPEPCWVCSFPRPHICLVSSELGPTMLAFAFIPLPLLGKNPNKTLLGSSRPASHCLCVRTTADGGTRVLITQWLSEKPYFPVCTMTSQVSCKAIHVKVSVIGQ